jgi:Uma2 family endonuclease
MIAIEEQTEWRIVLHGVPWDTYQTLRNADENYHLRMTYDRGALEIASPSLKHESISYMLGRTIDQWTLRHKIHIAAGRNSTFSRKDLERGLEPDNCYWITHEREIRGKDNVDLRFDPPPDFVLEVDVTSSSIPKIPIYAALGVPEVWHWNDDDKLEVLRLSVSGDYRAVRQSRELPKFPLKLAIMLVLDRHDMSDTEVISQFIKSIRKSRRK